jgi:hypothetical protein
MQERAQLQDPATLYPLEQYVLFNEAISIFFYLRFESAIKIYIL